MMRGEYCDDASWRTTTVIENATPATVRIEPAMVATVVRIPSGPTSKGVPHASPCPYV